MVLAGVRRPAAPGPAFRCPTGPLRTLSWSSHPVLGASFACRTPSVGRLHARTISRARGCRSRRRRRRDRAARGPNGAGKTTLLRLCAGLLPLRVGRGRSARCRSRGRPPLVPPGGRARRARDLLLRRPDRRREHPLRDPRRRATPPPTPTPRSSGSGSQRVANVAHGRLSQGQRRRLVARERARARAAAAAARRAARRPRRARPRGARRDRARRAGRGPHGDARVARARPRAAGSRRARCASSAGQVHAAAPRPAPSPSPGVGGARVSFLRDALLVAGKDLRIERRSRVALQQILPFGGIVVDDVRVRARLRPHARCPRRRPGLFWAAVLLAVLLAIGRSFAVEEANRRARRAAAVGARRRLDLPGQGRRGRGRAVPARGRARRGGGRALRRDACRVRWCCCSRRSPRPSGWPPPVRSTACWPAGLRARETLVPLLVLPAVTPVMLGATRRSPPRSTARPADAWPWVQLLAAFAVLAVAGGHGRVRAAAGGSVKRSVREAARFGATVVVARGHRGVRARGSRRPTPTRVDACGCSTSTSRRPGSRTSRSASPRSRRCCG